jgi:hypothetical protein
MLLFLTVCDNSAVILLAKHSAVLLLLENFANCVYVDVSICTLKLSSVLFKYIR